LTFRNTNRECIQEVVATVTGNLSKKEEHLRFFFFSFEREVSGVTYDFNRRLEAYSLFHIYFESFGHGKIMFYLK
jgi:hypothetical protein